MRRGAKPSKQRLEFTSVAAVPGTVVPGTVVPGTIVPGTIVPGTIGLAIGLEAYKIIRRWRDSKAFPTC